MSLIFSALCYYCGSPERRTRIGPKFLLELEYKSIIDTHSIYFKFGSSSIRMGYSIRFDSIRIRRKFGRTTVTSQRSLAEPNVDTTPRNNITKIRWSQSQIPECLVF